MIQNWSFPFAIALICLFLVQCDICMSADPNEKTWLLHRRNPVPLPEGLVTAEEKKRTLICNNRFLSREDKTVIPLEGNLWNQMLSRCLKPYYFSPRYKSLAVFPSQEAKEAYFKEENWQVGSRKKMTADEQQYLKVTMINTASLPLAPGVPNSVDLFVTADRTTVIAVHTPATRLFKEHPEYDHCVKIVDVQRKLARELVAATPGYKRKFIPGGPHVLHLLLEQEWQRHRLGDRLSRLITTGKFNDENVSNRDLLEDAFYEKPFWNHELISDNNPFEVLIGFNQENIHPVKRSIQTITIQGETLSYLLCYAGGDWEYPLQWIIYPDAETLRPRVFIPLIPNPWDIRNLMAFGNPDDLRKGLDREEMKKTLTRLGGPGFLEMYSEIVDDEDEWEALELLSLLMQGRHPEDVYDINNQRPMMLEKWLKEHLTPKKVDPRIPLQVSVTEQDLANVRNPLTFDVERPLRQLQKRKLEGKVPSVTLFGGPGVRAGDLDLLSSNKQTRFEIRNCSQLAGNSRDWFESLPWKQMTYLGLCETPFLDYNHRLKSFRQSAPDPEESPHHYPLEELSLGGMVFEKSPPLTDSFPNLKSLVCIHSRWTLYQTLRKHVHPHYGHINRWFLTAIEETGLDLSGEKSSLKELTTTALILAGRDVEVLKLPHSVEHLNLYLYAAHSWSDHDGDPFNHLRTVSRLNIQGASLKTVSLRVISDKAIVNSTHAEDHPGRNVKFECRAEIILPEGVQCQIAGNGEVVKE